MDTCARREAWPCHALVPVPVPPDTATTAPVMDAQPGAGQEAGDG